jgi:hypothetical protein
MTHDSRVRQPLFLSADRAETLAPKAILPVGIYYDRINAARY